MKGRSEALENIAGKTFEVCVIGGGHGGRLRGGRATAGVERRHGGGLIAQKRMKEVKDA